MSIKPISVVFSPEGQEKVTQAMESILQAAKRLEKAQISGIKAVNKEQIRSNKETHSQKMKFLKEELNVQKKFAQAAGRKGSDQGISTGGAGKSIGSSIGGKGASASSSGGVSGLIGKFGGMAAAAGAAIAALQQFSGYLLNDIIKPAWKLETRAQQSANSSGGAVTKDQLIASWNSVSMKHNVGKEEAANAYDVFQDLTGDAKQAMEMLHDSAKLSKATGADFEQIVTMAASIKGSANAQGAEMDTKQLSQIMTDILAQGVKGSIPLKNLAGLGGTFAALGENLAGTVDAQTAITGALLQTAKHRYGSASETATGMQGFMSKVLAKVTPEMAKFVTKDQKIGDIGGTIAEMLVKTGGDASKLKSIYGLDKEDAKFVNSVGLGAYQGAGGGEAGRAAVIASINDYATVKGDKTQIDKAEQDVLNTPGEKLETAVNTIDAALLRLKPIFDGIVSIFADVAPQIGTLGEFIGLVIGGLAALVAGILWVPLKIGQLLGKAFDWIIHKLHLDGFVDSLNLGKTRAEKDKEAAEKADLDKRLEDAKKGVKPSSAQSTTPTAAVPKTDAQIMAEAPKNAVRRIVTESEGPKTPIGPPTADGTLPSTELAPAGPAGVPAQNVQTASVESTPAEKANELAGELGKLMASAKGLAKTFEDLAASGDELARRTPLSDRTS